MVSRFWAPTVCQTGLDVIDIYKKSFTAIVMLPVAATNKSSQIAPNIDAVKWGGGGAEWAVFFKWFDIANNDKEIKAPPFFYQSNERTNERVFWWQISLESFFVWTQEKDHNWKLPTYLPTYYLSIWIEIYHVVLYIPTYLKCLISSKCIVIAGKIIEQT